MALASSRSPPLTMTSVFLHAGSSAYFFFQLTTEDKSLPIRALQRQFLFITIFFIPNKSSNTRSSVYA
jgi:hypothetical protein